MITLGVLGLVRGHVHQQDGGHGSRHPIMSVTTHLPNEPIPNDGAQATHPLLVGRALQ